MKHYLIAERYARGLGAAIDDDAQIDRVAEELRGLASLYADNTELRNVLANEAVHMEQRAKTLEEVLQLVGARKELHNLCLMLLRKHRITLLPDVAEIFRRIADTRMNQVRARVVTAVELDETQRARILASLEKYTSKNIRLDTAVDPSILGGVVAHLGSTVIDSSIKTRLERMHAQLLALE